jgi:hypothetical protein
LRSSRQRWRSALSRPWRWQSSRHRLFTTRRVSWTASSCFRTERSRRCSSRTMDPIARLLVTDAAARLGAISVSRLPLRFLCQPVACRLGADGFNDDRRLAWRSCARRDHHAGPGTAPRTAPSGRSRGLSHRVQAPERRKHRNRTAPHPRSRTPSRADARNPVPHEGRLATPGSGAREVTAGTSRRGVRRALIRRPGRRSHASRARGTPRRRNRHIRAVLRL